MKSIILYTVEHADITLPDASMSSEASDAPAQDIISFSKVDIITPSQKLLARCLTCDIEQGKSLLVTGK